MNTPRQAMLPASVCANHDSGKRLFKRTLTPMNTHTAALLADALLVLHVVVVLFVAGLLPLILVGGVRGWRWVRQRHLRSTHLGLMLFIVLQTWLGQLCPLTIWEQDLRHQAGQASHGGGFIEHWLTRLLYWDLPGWVFVAAYSGFAALVVGAWCWVRPEPSKALGQQLD